MDSPSYQYQYNCIPQKSHLWNRKQAGRCHCVPSSVLIFHSALAIKAGNRSVGRRLQPDWEWLHQVSIKKVFYFHLKSKKDVQCISSEVFNIRSHCYQARSKKFSYLAKICPVTADFLSSFDLKAPLGDITIIKFQSYI